MKKEYCKPDIMFESFSLSTDIAAGCGVIIRTFIGGQCGLDMGGEMLFVGDVQGCIEKVDDDGTSTNGICYHVPTNDTKMFNS